MSSRYPLTAILEQGAVSQQDKVLLYIQTIMYTLLAVISLFGYAPPVTFLFSIADSIATV
jgi:hypothetical protein